METGKILEILKAALILYKNGKIEFTAKDVIEANRDGYLNEKSTEHYYDECLYYLYTRNLFGRSLDKNDNFIGYTFEQAKLSYLK